MPYSYRLNYSEISGRNFMRALGTQHSALGTQTSLAKARQLCRLGESYAFYTIAILAAILLVCSFSFAQDKDEQQHPEEPTIVFDLYWEAATPQNYTVTVQASGKAKYVSRDPTRVPEGAEAADPDYVLEFTMSAATRDRLFLLGKAANYFQGDFDYKHKVANTGRKTVTYADPARHFQTTYNFSENKDIQEVTRIFQGISNTIEHGRKLQFMRRFDKLGLERELRGMEEMAQSGYLVEIQIIASILQNIINDSSVLNIARERARRLMASGL